MTAREKSGCETPPAEKEENPMSTSLSLFDIEAGLHELFDVWQDAKTPEELQAAESAIQAYARAEVQKVDGVRRYIKACDAQEKAAREEAKLQSERAAMWGARRDRLKQFCFETMKSFGRQKIEGSTGYLRIQANGGKQSVIVSDEAMVPDEFCTVTVTMPRALWRRLEDFVRTNSTRIFPEVQQQGKIGPRTPALSLIAAELERPCERCDGAPAVGTTDACQWCGGSGKRGVPGCSLAPRGEHLRVG